MRPKHIIVLALAVFLFLSPVISYTIRASIQNDSTYESDSSSLDEVMERQEPAMRALVYTITIEGAIGTVTDDRIAEAIELAEEDGAALLVLIMDTPGGFTKPTWSICKSILNAGVPVCTYVAPSGARAGSAGVYITCLLYTSPSPRDRTRSRMPSSA